MPRPARGAASWGGLDQAGISIVEAALVKDGAAIGGHHSGLGHGANVQLPGKLVAGIGRQQKGQLVSFGESSQAGGVVFFAGNTPTKRTPRAP